jgi:cation diffusion facilitator family transporter
MATIETGLRLSKVSLAVNALLAGIKIAAGVFGNSYVLVADGIESIADVFSSLVVWSGLRLAIVPADENHPYGHGKAESLAGIFVALLLLAAAILIAVQSIREILTPHLAPAWFTLPVLLLVIAIKETLFRLAHRAGHSLESTALKGDAWHHRSDALTSAAAFVGISIAFIGGRGYESADDWAALLACGVIGTNGLRLLRTALDELMDAAVSPEIVAAVRKIAAEVVGVVAVEKCRVRKSGLHLALDIHVVVDGSLSVWRGHQIAHNVKDHLMASPHRINDVTVHIEPNAL